MATRTVLTRTYAQIAADITAVDLVQCPDTSGGSNLQHAIELVVAADTPAATVAGIQLRRGETITSGNLADLGASGKLYARAALGSTAGVVLTLPDA
jgi:hypothetical protein